MTHARGTGASPPGQWPGGKAVPVSAARSPMALMQQRHPQGRAYQDVRAGDRAEPQVLHGPLLQLHVRILQLAVTAQHILDGGLHLRKEVHELDVGGQEERPGGDAAQVELRVQQVELDQGAGTGKESKRHLLTSHHAWRSPMHLSLSLRWSRWGEGESEPPGNLSHSTGAAPIQ